jgi:hypothetical protein
MAPTKSSPVPPSENGNASKGRHAAEGGRDRAAATGKEKERQEEKQRDRDDPKHVGPWRIGRTIGKGSSGELHSRLEDSCRNRGAGRDGIDLDSIRAVLMILLYVGRVKIARHTVTRQYAAVKIVPKPRPTSSNATVKADKVRPLSRTHDC